MKRIENSLLNVMALAWLGRGAWRISRGRAPWRSRF
jgi:hypothetical protein